MWRPALAGGVMLAASLAIHAQGPVPPSFSGVWTFLKEPDGPVFQQAVLGDRFTVEQSATALVITRPMMVKRSGEAATREDYHYTYPFNESDTPEPQCAVAKAGWDGPSLIIVTTYRNSGGCYSLSKQTKVILHLDNDGRLVVEQTTTYSHGSFSLANVVGGRLIPGDEPQVVWINRYEKVKTPISTRAGHALRTAGF